MALTSTVPGAITTLQGYMNTVAAASAVSNVQVYLGKSAASSQLAYNFMMVGDYENGIPVAPDSYTWAAIPGQSVLILERYALQACIGCWAGSGSGDGGTAALARLSDAYSLLNSLHSQIRTDLGGSGNLSPSGSWGELNVVMHEFGAVSAGWGVILGLELHVINAQITGP